VKASRISVRLLLSPLQFPSEMASKLTRRTPYHIHHSERSRNRGHNLVCSELGQLPLISRVNIEHVPAPRNNLKHLLVEHRQHCRPRGMAVAASGTLFQIELGYNEFPLDLISLAYLKRHLGKRLLSGQIRRYISSLRWAANTKTPK
jgi:hypothetical protein